MRLTFAVCVLLIVAASASAQAAKASASASSKPAPPVVVAPAAPPVVVYQRMPVADGPITVRPLQSFASRAACATVGVVGGIRERFVGLFTHLLPHRSVSKSRAV